MASQVIVGVFKQTYKISVHEACVIGAMLSDKELAGIEELPNLKAG